MWNSYRRRPEIGEAWKCPTCGLMITSGHICRVRETVQCPDCKAMLEKGLEAKHHCPAKLAREKAEWEARKAEKRAARAAIAKDKRAKGLVPRVKMIKPKEKMIFTELVLRGDWSSDVEQVEVVKNPWKCRICGNVWQTEHEARACAFERQILGIGQNRIKAPHAKYYFKLYGVQYVENGMPRGRYMREIVFNVMRTEPVEVLPEGKKWDMEDVVDEQKAEEILQKAWEKEPPESQADTLKGMSDKEIEESGLEKIDDDPGDSWAGTQKEFD